MPRFERRAGSGGQLNQWKLPFGTKRSQHILWRYVDGLIKQSLKEAKKQGG